MSILEGQILQKQCLVMLWHAEVVSGGYKLKQLHHGNGVAFTEEEKLKDAINTLTRHIHQMSEMIDMLPEQKKKEGRCPTCSKP
jgi:hypothetical protein